MAMTAEEMLARLVGFDTTSRNSNLPLIHWVRDYLAEHGIAATLVPDATGQKANLYATIGPMVADGIVLSGHTDVVPVDGQHWTSDPWSLTARDNRFYGRGTADMKAFSAIALSLLPEMLTADLRRPIHLALSYDEEVGCLGAPAMIAEIVDVLPRPRAVLVGEPTEMQVVTAHKGICAVATTVTGHEVHSSQPHRGVSAVMVAGQLIQALQDRAAAHVAEQRAEGFAPPHSTVTINTIQGGTATNIMAAQCRFTWDMRAVPGDDPAAFVAGFDAWCQQIMLPPLQAISPDCSIKTEILAAAPPLSPMQRCPAEELARRLTGDNGTHHAAYAAEAGQFQQAGLPTVLCGPGSIDQAHQPDEYISEAQLQAGIAFQRKLIAELSA